MMRNLSLVSLIAAASLASACTTFGRKAGSDADVDSPRQVVVSQPGRALPAVSAYGRKYWFDLRQSKAILPRIHGALATGEADIAADMARGYLQKHPGDPKGLTLLAAALALGRKYELADYYATLAERARPNDATALNIRGVALLLQPKNRVADFKRAEAFFRRAFDADPTQIAAGLNLGSLQLELGNAGAAQATFARVSQRCGECTAGLMGYGIASQRVGAHEKAKEAFEQVLSKQPAHAAAHYHLALVHKNGYNDRKQAEKHLFAVINAAGSEVDMKERAHTVLRAMKGEKEPSERTAIADDDHDLPLEQSAADDREAELLMTGAEKGE